MSLSQACLIPMGHVPSLILVGHVPSDIGRSATVFLASLDGSGRNARLQPPTRHPSLGALWPSIRAQGSVRTQHHCCRGLNPPFGGPYQVLLAIGHLSFLQHQPTRSKMTQLLLPKMAKITPSEPSPWAVAANILAYALVPGLLFDPCGTYTE